MKNTEEKLRVDMYGNDYLEYCKNVKALDQFLFCQSFIEKGLGKSLFGYLCFSDVFDVKEAEVDKFYKLFAFVAIFNKEDLNSKKAGLNYVGSLFFGICSRLFGSYNARSGYDIHN